MSLNTRFKTVLIAAIFLEIQFLYLQIISVTFCKQIIIFVLKLISGVKQSIWLLRNLFMGDFLLQLSKKVYNNKEKRAESSSRTYWISNSVLEFPNCKFYWKSLKVRLGLIDCLLLKYENCLKINFQYIFATQR